MEMYFNIFKGSNVTHDISNIGAIIGGVYLLSYNSAISL
jgi:hypothetical protein